MGVTLYPSVELPFVMVQTRYVGASPNEIEQMVTRPLEDALADLEGLRTITSFSQDGVSILSIEMMSGTNPDLALVDVNNKIRGAMHLLPDGAREPVSTKFDINGNKLETFLSHRVLTMDVEKLKQVADSIALVAGKDKILSLVAGARGGYITTMIIDEITALSLLDYFEREILMHRESEETVRVE